MEYKIRRTFISVLFILIVSIFISSNLKLLGTGDDLFFSTALDSKSLLEFLKIRYYTWTGRISVEGLMVLTINYPWYWKIIIPASTIIIAASITVIAGYKNNSAIYMTSFVFGSMLLLISTNIINDAMWWIVGSYNYLQPIAAGLFSIAIHIRKNHLGSFSKILSLFLLAFACFNEQLSVMVLIPYIAIYTMIKKDFSFYNICYLICALSLTIFSLTAPGNQARLVSEIAYWMPDYADLGLIEKIALGFDKLSSHIGNQNILFNFFIIFISYLAIRKKKLDLSSLIALSILSLKMITFFLFMSKLSIVNKLSNPNALDFGEIARTSTFIPHIFSLMILFSCIQILNFLSDNTRDFLTWVVAFILAIGSVVMLSMTPTVYASGARVLFLFDIFILFISTSMIKQLTYS